jgi:Fatty-acid desaturase
MRVAVFKPLALGFCTLRRSFYYNHYTTTATIDDMLYWTLQRVFGTCTLIIYVTFLILVDLQDAQLQALRLLTWVLIFIQIFRHATLGMTLGFHRYYSHAAFKAKRWLEFVLTYSCAAANQGSMSWWAGNHRHHHRHCDTEQDPHSPVTHSILYAWVGWTYDLKNARRRIRLSYPETVWLDKWCFLVPWLEWATVWYMTGSRAFSTLVILLPAWLSPIGTLWFNVGSHGGKPDQRGCTARTYAIPSAIILGESAHKDHHEHPGKARRPGADLPYRLILRPLAHLGAVWNLRK